MEIKRKRENAGHRAAGPGVPAKEKWRLRLFVAGQSPRGITALNNLKLICEDQLNGRYHIEVIDLLKYPGLARDNQICAVPTLVRRLPRPVRNIIGDLSNTEVVLAGLDLVHEGAR